MPIKNSNNLMRKITSFSCSIFSLEEESNVSVCGSTLSKTNVEVSKAFPLFAGAFASIDEYICIIITGQLKSYMSGTCT